jgi:signal transduction histidine kinase/CheY-like chemotaxis protein
MLTRQSGMLHKTLIAPWNVAFFRSVARGKDRDMRSARDPVYAEQVRSSYAHLPLTLSVSVLNSLLLGFVLATVASGLRILIWVALVAGLSVLRVALWHAHRRLDVGPWHNPWWTRLAVTGAFASGVLWGLGSVIVAPLDEPHLLFVALVICGMCAGAATVHAAHFPSVVAFIVPAIVPLAANFFVEGNRLQVISGIMACVFGISLCIASLRFRRWFRDTTSARLDLAFQTLEINEANAQLRSEIASRRSTEAKLQHAQKMEAIGLLTAGVAHDFNNLLMAIGGSAELIWTHLSLDSVRRPYVATIIQAVERGATLTRQLLAFGRKQTLVPRSADLNQVILAIEELLVTTLGGYGCLELRLDPAPMTAFVDTVELERAILNLVINARDAMPNGGSVTITTANRNLDGTDIAIEGLAGSSVMISVSDTGTGMSESVRLRAFDPFFTTKDFGRGSGLGLSQVYGLIEQSGGATRIDSHPGSGTTVTIYLPKSEKATISARATQVLPSSPIPVSSASNSSHLDRRILVLDDDKLVLETVTEILSGAGYTVVAFAAALQALAEVSGSARIDLMVVDFAMPDMRGDQFAARARLQRPAVPILFISGYAEPAALQAEPFVLRKPFSMNALITITEEVMRIAA